MVAVAPGLHGLFDGVEDRQAVGVLGAALAGRDAADHLGAVVEAALGVDGPEAPVMPWQMTRVSAVDEDGHGDDP
jgi:hypothetical protein